MALPVLYSFGLLPDRAWTTVLASWNTLLLLWIGVLVWLRGKNKIRRDWSWAIPVALGLCSLNWLAPEFFSLGDCLPASAGRFVVFGSSSARTRPEWLRDVSPLPVPAAAAAGGMFWQLSRTPALPDDNGLFWRITQHAGAQLLPNVSSHVLVATHVFLEMLHYGVWLVALPLIAPLAEDRQADGRSRSHAENRYSRTTCPCRLLLPPSGT